MSRLALLRAVVIATAVAVALPCDVADAAQRRSSSAKRKKQIQEQKAYMLLEMMRYQSEVAAKQQEIYQSFDKDGDGKLSSPEKSQYDKHLRDIQKGAVQNPFAFITPVGQGPKPKSPIEALQEKTTEQQAGLIAKQREIVTSFDTDGDGELKGPEKSKFDKYMHDVQTGKVPNPFAAVGAGTSSSK